jgi:UDP-N-acetylmuramyl-tripeptide synthetase
LKPSPASVDDLKSIEQHLKKLAARVSPSVVAVQVGGATGSGVVITEDGLVLTAAHVSGRPKENVTFTFPDGTKAKGITLGTDHEFDAGLMKITDPGQWPRVEIADAQSMRLGDWVLALGHPGGFDAGVFTNLTQDHLDFHGTLEAYRDAKARLFRSETRGDTTKKFVAVLNVDDPAGIWIRERSDGPTLGFGMGREADVAAEDVRYERTGTRLRIRGPHDSQSVALRLRGAFNVMNALAAFATGLALGVPPRAIAAGLESVRSVPGRLEPVDQGQPFQVLVDYAHTPDALARALEAVRAMEPRRVLCVFGAGGDRDRGKRPLMGAAAVRGADLVFLTSDNPRSENPESILAAIEAGTGGAPNVRTIVDRAEAIRAAVDACEDGDALLIAGKGHETYQILGSRTIDFDDRLVARAALEAKGFRG